MGQTPQEVDKRACRLMKGWQSQRPNAVHACLTCSCLTVS